MIEAEIHATLLPLGTNAGVLTGPNQQPLSYVLEIRQLSTLNSENGQKIQILFDVGSKFAVDPKYVQNDALVAVFLSHDHLDHTRYLGPLIKRLKKQQRTRPLFVYCQENAWGFIRWLIRISCGHIPSFVQFIPTNVMLDDPRLKSHTKTSRTDYRQISHLAPLIIQKTLHISIDVAPAKHSKSAVAYRLKLATLVNENIGTTQLDLVFSPDTSYQSDHLIPFAQNTTYWLLDAGYTKEEIDLRFEKFQKRQRGGEIVCHSSPHYSGRLCEAAHVKNYIVIHYVWPRFGKTLTEFIDNVKTRIKAVYSGNIIISLDLQPIILC